VPGAGVVLGSVSGSGWNASEARELYAGLEDARSVLARSASRCVIEPSMPPGQDRRQSSPQSSLRFNRLNRRHCFVPFFPGVLDVIATATGPGGAAERPGEARRQPQLRRSVQPLPDPFDRGQRQRPGGVREDHPAVSRGAGASRQGHFCFVLKNRIYDT